MGIGFVPPMPYAFCARSDLFAPSVETKVVRGAQVAVIANHTRPWTPAAPTVGPPPSKLGLDPTPLPHAPPNDPGLLSAVQASKSIPRLIAPTEDPQSPGGVLATASVAESTTGSASDPAAQRDSAPTARAHRSPACDPAASAGHYPLIDDRVACC